MAESTKISWTDATFNPWRGCTKVSAGCAHCYADTQSKRNPLVLGVWGPNGTRVVAAESQWREPVRWNRLAAEGRLPDGSPNPDGHRPRVFCASLADVFEAWDGSMVDSHETEMCVCHDCGGWMYYTARECTPKCRSDRAPRRLTMDDVRRRLFDLIDATPNLNWLLVTKRPENIARMMPPATAVTDNVAGRKGLCLTETGPLCVRPNVWLLASVENQDATARIGELLKVPAAVHGLSMEPLLGPVVLPKFTCRNSPCVTSEMLRQRNVTGFPCMRCNGDGTEPGIDWCIIGGESGGSARPFDLAWARSLRDQCGEFRIPVFFKQMGENVAEFDGLSRVRFRDKGGNLADIPADLRIREFPEAPRG